MYLDWGGGRTSSAKGRPSEKVLADGSDLSLTWLPYAMHPKKHHVSLFQKCALLMEEGQVATFTPLKTKLHLFPPNIKVKILMSYLCLTLDSTIMRWSAVYFKSNHSERG